MTSCKPTRRTRRLSGRPGTQPEDHLSSEPAPRVVAVFRRADGTVCHTRCGRSLALQGLRGDQEADFYCYACLAHVTLPVAVLADLPVAPDAAPGTLLAR